MPVIFFNRFVTFNSAVFGWTFTFCRRPFGVNTFTTLPLILLTLLKSYSKIKLYAKIRKKRKNRILIWNQLTIKRMRLCVITMMICINMTVQPGLFMKCVLNWWLRTVRELQMSQINLNSL